MKSFSPLYHPTFPSISSFLGLALLIPLFHTTSLLGPHAVSLMPPLIQPTTSWLFQAQETQVPCSLLMCLRGPLSPIPPAWQGWNPNSSAAPLLVPASPGTFIFLFPSLRILRVPPQWSIDRRSGGCDPYKGSQRWDTRKGALYGVIECLADGNRGALNGVLCCQLEREWQGQVWAIWKRHFEITLLSDVTTQSQPRGGPLQLAKNIRWLIPQYSVNVLIWEVRATQLIMILAPFPESWACCSPGCNRIGLMKQRPERPAAVWVDGMEN